MDIKWKILLIKTLTWLAAEIVLNSMGLDTLADYGEFVLEQNGIIHLSCDRNSLKFG